MFESGMAGPAVTFTIGASLVLAAVFGLLAALGRRGHPALAVPVEAGLLVVAGQAVASAVAGSSPQRPVVFVLYFLATLALLPVAAAWAWFEPSRWAPVVMAVACLVVPVLVVRLQQVWLGG